MNDCRLTSSFPSLRQILPTALLALGALVAAACESAPDSAQALPHQADLSQEIKATATVVSVDSAARVVTLRSEDGSLFSVQCGPAVRNFDQIAAGDHLNVRYQETLTATLRPAGEKATPAEGAAIAGRARPGETPAAGAAVGFTVRVRIESVDKPNHIVVFSLSSGELRTVRASRQEGRAFIDGLKVGDIVQLDYTASAALAIEKV